MMGELPPAACFRIVSWTSLSIGWSKIDINPRFQFALAKAGQPIQTSEQIIELDYAFQLTPSLFFRPGIQYDIRPGGTSTHPNTWIFDFHIQLTLMN